MKSVPDLSVVMPVKDARPYLDVALESILDQGFANFEFVIRDDNSTDGSRERLRYWAAKDKRIRLFEGEKSLGPAGSSNWVVAQARAPIVARMDADDISLPDRLRTQLEILEQNPDAVLVGSTFEMIDRQGHIVREPDLSVLRTSRFAAPFSHGSIMFRRDAFDRAGGYRDACNFWEDLDLCVRMAALGRVLVTTEPLYRHRASQTSTRLTSTRRRVEESVDLMFACRKMHERGENYASLLGPEGRAAPAKLKPETFISLGSITLWSGLRPRTLIQLLKSADLRADMGSIRALGWATWALTSPGSLRSWLRLRLRMKNKTARQELAGQRVCEWRLRPAAGTMPAAGFSTADHALPYTPDVASQSPQPYARPAKAVV